MSNEIASLEAEAKEYKLQLETVQSGLLADPENHELQNLKAELEEVITLTASAIAELKPVSAASPTSSLNNTTTTNYNSRQQSTQSNNTNKEPEKWFKANHPAYLAGYKPPPSPTVPTEQQEEKTTFSVNDSVLAKWKSGDRGFYPARITSITGSSTNPVYIVTFKSYATTETLSSHEIKPLASNDPNKKRKLDAPSSPTIAGGGSGGVISKGATVDEALVGQAKREPSKVSDGPVRPAKIPRKVKANKELEAGKSKWQQFSTMGGKKQKSTIGKKESMFRTGEGVNARVGFTGSGQEMRKDVGRARHVYQEGGEEEY